MCGTSSASRGSGSKLSGYKAQKITPPSWAVFFYLIRNRGISCCGAYWRFGFHEDGVVSALAVCERFGARP